MVTGTIDNGNLRTIAWQRVGDRRTVFGPIPHFGVLTVERLFTARTFSLPPMKIAARPV